MSANSKQIGGSHYADGGEVQHWDFIAQNGLSYLVGCATKYVTRHRKKHGKQDLEKALHYIEKLQELYAQGLVKPDAHAWPLAITVPEFARANGLSEAEEAVVLCLAGWADDRALLDAWEIVDGLIKEA